LAKDVEEDEVEEEGEGDVREDDDRVEELRGGAETESASSASR